MKRTSPIRKRHRRKLKAILETHVMQVIDDMRAWLDQGGSLDDRLYRMRCARVVSDTIDAIEQEEARHQAARQIVGLPPEQVSDALRKVKAMGGVQ